MNKDKIKKMVLIVHERSSDSGIAQISVLMAYYMLLSLFPLIMALGNLLPYLNLDPAVLMQYMQTIVPDAIFIVLAPIIEGLLTSSSGGLLSLGALGLLWSGSKGIHSLQMGMNKAYGLEARSSYIAKRVLSLATLLLMGVVLVAFILLFGFGASLFSLLGPIFSWAFPLAEAIHNLRWPIMIVFLLIMMTIIYMITVDIKIRVLEAVPGAILSAIGLLVLAEAFAIYVRFANRTISSYGTLSTFFVLMFWTHFSAGIVLAGGILNASIRQYRWGRADVNTGERDYRLIDKILKKWIEPGMREWVQAQKDKHELTEAEEETEEEKKRK